jgi:hypothetical protein
MHREKSYLIAEMKKIEVCKKCTIYLAKYNYELCVFCFEYSCEIQIQDMGDGCIWWKG